MQYVPDQEQSQIYTIHEWALVAHGWNRLPTAGEVKALGRVGQGWQPEHLKFVCSNRDVPEIWLDYLHAQGVDWHASVDGVTSFERLELRRPEQVPRVLALFAQSEAQALEKTVEEVAGGQGVMNGRKRL